MRIETVTFDEILPVWRKLWPNRVSPIEPVCSMVYGGGCDLSIKKFSPTFFVIRSGSDIVAVNSGVKTAEFLYRIRGLYVEPEYRSQGMATRLITAVCDQAIVEDCLSIWAMPRKTSVRLFEKVGFIRMSDWFDEGVEFGPNCYVKKHLDV
jgi:GNAT superfamily N-acetyltransferase